MVTPQLKSKNITYYTLLLIAGCILTFPLVGSQIIPGHDHVFHISRIQCIAEALKTGVFPVRMYVDSVRFWGAPVGFFYPGLFNYIPAILLLIGLPIEICYNSFIILIFFLGLFASWQGFSILTKSKNIGLFSTALYISSGYYLMDAYIRNALGELLSLSFLPLAIASFANIINKTKVSFKIYVFFVISISAVIESHLLSSVFLILFCSFYLLLHHKKLTVAICKRVVLISLIVFLLNASFTIPFLFLYKAVPLSVEFINRFSQFCWSPITICYFLIYMNFWLFTSLYMFLSTKFHCFYTFSNNRKKLFLYYSSYMLTGIFFLFIASTLFPWNQLTPLKNIFKIMQFPWRFLGISTIFLCVCGGFGLHLLSQRFKLNIVISQLFIIIICITNVLCIFMINSTPIGGMPTKTYWKRFPVKSDFDYLYKDIDIKTLFEQGNRFETNAKISNYKKNLTDISFYYTTPYDAKIVLPLVNYPGYIVKKQNGDKISKINIAENDNHMIMILLPTGNGTINVHYEGLTVFKIADYVSAISLLVFILYVIRNNKLKGWNKLI